MRRMGERAELQSRLRKSRILDKAETIFWQKGYQSTTIKDIATACGCRPANIYNYFASKEDILFGVISDIMSQATDLVKPLGEDLTTSPAELLRQLIAKHFGFLAGMKQSIVSITDTGLKDLTPAHRQAVVELREVYDNALLKILRRGKATGEFGNIDERVVGYLIPSLIVRSNVWFSPQGRLSVDEVSDIIFHLVYDGMKPRNERTIGAADCLPIGDPS
jgi:AcrR family transcriptional regulator